MDWRKLKKGRPKKVLLGLAIFFSVYTLFGFFVLPAILEAVLPKKLSEALHREVTIQQIKVNPYALSATIRGFRVQERDSSRTFASFDELYLNLQSISVLKMAVVLKELRLKHPYINIIRRNETTYNFSDLLVKKERPKTAEKPAEKPKLIRFSLNNIRIENGSVDFWDEPRQTRHTVRELNLGVPFLSDIPAQVTTFVQPFFSAKINGTSYVLKGKTKPFADSLETKVTIDVRNFDIPHYLAYFPLKLNYKIVSAYLDMQTEISFIQYKNKGPSLTVAGNVSLKNVALDDEKQQPLFRLPRLEIGIASAEPLKKSIHLSSVTIESPELEIRRDPAGALNIASLFVAKHADRPSSGTGKKQGEALLSIDVDEVRLTGGRVSFSDFSRKKPFKTILYPIELKVDHFSNGQDKKTAYALSISSEAKEKITLGGELSVEPLRAEGRLEVKGVPLQKYSPYYQDKIRFNLEEGRLHFSTRYNYARGEKGAEISLAGLALSLNSLRLRRPGEKEDFLKIPVLAVQDTLVDVTGRQVTVGSFSTQKGMLVLKRFKNGDLDLQRLFPPSSPRQESPEQKKGREETKSWVVTVKKMLMDQYAVRLDDQTPSSPTTVTAERITVRGENITTAKNTPGTLSLSLLLDRATTISAKSTIRMDPLNIAGDLKVNRLVLNKYAPYYQDGILFDIESGDLDLSTHYQYGKAEKDTTARLSSLSVVLRALKLKKRGEKEAFADIPVVTIRNTGIDLRSKACSIGEFSTRKGTLLIRRFRDGKLNLQSLFPEPAKTEDGQNEKAHPTVERVGQAEKPWLVKAGKVSVDDYTINVEDRAPAEPVNLVLDDFRLKADNLSTAEGHQGNAALSLRFNQKGTISMEGRVGMSPVSANLKMSLQNIEVRPLQPYFTDKVKIAVTEGAVSTTGNLTLKYSGKKELKVTYGGDASLNKLATIDKHSAEDVLKVESLAFDGLRFDSSPFALKIKGIALSDFYARLVINPDGTLNLQQILAKGGSKKESPARKESASPASGKEEEGPPRNIGIGNITLQGGRIEFSDRSVKPEFTLRLTEMSGRVSGLSSEETALGDVELQAKVNNYAPIEITGKINPLKKDLYVDLKVRFKDLDLSSASPYSAKYVGYTIQKGKLSFDLSYLIDKGKLDSQNVIFLDQFNLGTPVKSPDATSLPVKLAIALLKDRNGQIKLDIPVSGSLDDPHFSVWGIVGKVIVNLVAKAATSPFALLGAIFGGGEELSHIEFGYGSASVTASNQKKIDTLTKALSDRPELKLDIEGHVDPERDREALKQLFFQRKLKAEKLKAMLSKGLPPVPLDEVKIEPQEYATYLKLAYKEEKFSKPRNFLGFAKDIPGPEMEKLMLAHIEVKESDLRSLANRRAMRVKDAILKSGKVEPERIFILEPKSLSPEKKENLKDSRVELELK